MIKITVELFPFGDESSKKTLLKDIIGNDTTEQLEVGNYKYTFSNDKKKIFNGEVKNHIRAEPIQKLLINVLNDISKIEVPITSSSKEKKSHGRPSKV